MKKITCLLLIIVCIISVCLLSSCDDKNEDGIYYVDENIKYSYDLLHSTVMNIPFSFALDNYDSYVEFNTDKTVKIRFMANTYLLNKMIDIDDLNELIQEYDVEKIFNFYAPEFIPGASIDDIGKTFNLLCQSLNLTFVGMDFINEQSAELASILKKEIPIPEDYKIPEEFGFEYNGTYYIKDVETENGIEKGVFIGEYDEKTEPYLIMTMYEETNDNGETINKLTYRIEPINMVAYLNEV